jgi:hypothetical protein
MNFSFAATILFVLAVSGYPPKDPQASVKSHEILRAILDPLKLFAAEARTHTEVSVLNAHLSSKD